MKITFRLRFFIPFLLLFITEVLIALFINDNVIRPYIGDVLVVILIYFFVRTLFTFRHVQVAIGVLIFSYAVESAQYFNVVNLLGLQHNGIARIVIGTSFSVFDLFAYTAGIVMLFIPMLIRSALVTPETG